MWTGRSKSPARRVRIEDGENEAERATGAAWAGVVLNREKAARERISILVGRGRGLLRLALSLLFALVSRDLEFIEFAVQA